MKAKPNSAKSTKPKKKGSDIPLDNIPERPTKTHTYYTNETKLQAVTRVRNGETADSVAADMGIPSGSMIHKWIRLVDQGLPLNAKPGGVGGGRASVDLASS